MVRITTLLLRDMLLLGKRRPAEFLESDERISTNILTNRLKRLEAADMVRRRGTGQRNQVHYLPTDKAVDVLPVLFDMALWSMRHESDSAPLQSVIDRIRTDPDAYIADIRAGIARERPPRPEPRSKDQRESLSRNLFMSAQSVSRTADGWHGLLRSFRTRSSRR